MMPQDTAIAFTPVVHVDRLEALEPQRLAHFLRVVGRPAIEIKPRAQEKRRSRTVEYPAKVLHRQSSKDRLFCTHLYWNGVTPRL